MWRNRAFVPASSPARRKTAATVGALTCYCSGDVLSMTSGGLAIPRWLRAGKRAWQLRDWGVLALLSLPYHMQQCMGLRS